MYSKKVSELILYLFFFGGGGVGAGVGVYSKLALNRINTVCCLTEVLMMIKDSKINQFSQYLNYNCTEYLWVGEC